MKSERRYEDATSGEEGSLAGAEPCAERMKGSGETVTDLLFCHPCAARMGARKDYRSAETPTGRSNVGYFGGRPSPVEMPRTRREIHG